MKIPVVPPVTRLLLGAVTYLATVAGAVWMLGEEAWRMFSLVAIYAAAVLSPFVGAAVVWWIVRQTNRRDDHLTIEAEPPLVPLSQLGKQTEHFHVKPDQSH